MTDPLATEKRDKLVELLFNFLKTQHFGPIPLASDMSTRNIPKKGKNRWTIIENTTIESDI